MSYEAIGSGSISLNTMTAMEQKNLQAALLERYEKLRMADVAHCGDAMVCQIEREYQERRQTMLKYNDPFWWLTVVFQEVGFTEVERNPDDGALSIELSYCNNYYEDTRALRMCRGTSWINWMQHIAGRFPRSCSFHKRWL